MRLLQHRGWRRAAIVVGAILSATVLAPGLAGADGGVANAAPARPSAPSIVDHVVAPVPAAGTSNADGAGSGEDAAAQSGSVSSQAVQSVREPIAPISVPYAGWPITRTTNVAFTASVDCSGLMCQLPLDVYAPTGPGPYPTLVLLRGGPGWIGGRGYLRDFAAYLASIGILVFLPETRDLAYMGGGLSTSLQDAACAVRFARAQSAAYGGDSGPVTVVGHSYGGYIGALLALDDTEPQGGCLYGGSGRPDAFVGLAGCYDLTDPDLFTTFEKAFGGPSATTAAMGGSANVFNDMSRSRIPVRLVAGTDDGTVNPAASTKLAGYLSAKGWNVSLALVDGGAHMSILDEPQTRQAVLGAIAVAQASENAIDSTGGSPAR